MQTEGDRKGRLFLVSKCDRKQIDTRKGACLLLSLSVRSHILSLSFPFYHFIFFYSVTSPLFSTSSLDLFLLRVLSFSLLTLAVFLFSTLPFILSLIAKHTHIYVHMYAHEAKDRIPI